MGRNRKTTADLKLSGQFGKHSSRKDWNQETPTPIDDADFIQIPPGFLARTRRAFKAFLAAKACQKILSEEDEPLVLAMFQSLDAYFRITDQLTPLLKHLGEEGAAELDRLSRVQRRYLDSFTMLAVKFGLSPTERSKLSIPQQKEESDIFKFLEMAKEEDRKAAQGSF